MLFGDCVLLGPIRAFASGSVIKHISIRHIPGTAEHTVFKLCMSVLCGNCNVWDALGVRYGLNKCF